MLYIINENVKEIDDLFENSLYLKFIFSVSFVYIIGYTVCSSIINSINLYNCLSV